jgi:hypothetical protein
MPYALCLSYSLLLPWEKAGMRVFLFPSTQDGFVHGSALNALGDATHLPDSGVGGRERNRRVSDTTE